MKVLGELFAYLDAKGAITPIDRVRAVRSGLVPGYSLWPPDEAEGAPLDASWDERRVPRDPSSRHVRGSSNLESESESDSELDSESLFESEIRSKAGRSKGKRGRVAGPLDDARAVGMVVRAALAEHSGVFAPLVAVVPRRRGSARPSVANAARAVASPELESSLDVRLAERLASDDDSVFAWFRLLRFDVPETVAEALARTLPGGLPPTRREELVAMFDAGATTRHGHLLRNADFKIALALVSAQRALWAAMERVVAARPPDAPRPRGPRDLREALRVAAPPSIRARSFEVATLLGFDVHEVLGLYLNDAGDLGPADVAIDEALLSCVVNACFDEQGRRLRLEEMSSALLERLASALKWMTAQASNKR